MLVNGIETELLPADDPAIGAGIGVYEALRTYDGHPFRLAEHLRRLRASAAWFGLRCPEDEVLHAELASVASAVEGEATLLVTLTGGGNRIVRALPLDHLRVNAPLRVATIAYEAPPSLPGWVKHTSRAEWLLAAQQANVDEVLFVGSDGTWTEANRSNVFAVRGGELITPPTDGRILAGVTRGVMIEAAREAGICVREEVLVPGAVEELHLVSTLKEIAPVVQLDGVDLPGWGTVGLVLREAFRRRSARLDLGA